jgi:hypothetical protein
MATDAAPADDPQEKGGVTRSVWNVLGRVSLVVGVVGAVLGLVFTLFPDLRPIGRPEKTTAELADLRVEPGLTFRQYLQRVDQEPGGLDAATLARRGAFLEFDIVSTGLREEELALKVELVDATGDEVGQEQSTTVTPKSNEDAIAWHAFLPYPARSQPPYVGRVVLLDGEGDSLASERTEPFGAPAAS